MSEIRMIEPHEQKRLAIEARIARAKAAQAALEAETAEDRELARLERTARIEEQRALDEPHIKEAREKHGDENVAVIDTDLGAIVVKRPNHLKWNALVAKGDKITQIDMAGLVKACLVHPTWQQVDKILEEAPAALPVITDAIAGLAKHAARERSGK